jgi:hypothetical protein
MFLISDRHLDMSSVSLGHLSESYFFSRVHSHSEKFNLALSSCRPRNRCIYRSRRIQDEIRTSKEMDKDQKDLKDVTEVPSPEPKGPVQDLGGLNQLITRVSGLEQSVEESKGLKK